MKSIQAQFKYLSHFLEKWKASVNESPIIVLGNQKSGTTAIAVLLAERTGLNVEWDLSMHNYSLVVDIYRGDRTINHLVEKNKIFFSKDIIKDCTLTFLLGSLQKRFPEAHFVTVMRDPRDNIRSILDRLNLPGDRLKIERSQYNEMSDVWEGVIDGSWMGIQGENYIDTLAERWRIAAKLYLERENDIELIRYEDFLDGKVEAIDNLASQLGLDRRNRIEDQVDQQFQPCGQRRNIEYKEFFGEKNLWRIESHCADEMRQLGYSNFRMI